MIPPYFGPECLSPGEQELFLKMKESPGTENWVVLHSLDIAHHSKRIAGELDFLVIVPGRGVLALEVKACQQLHRRDGLWYYGTSPEPDHRGPFKQVSEAMHSLRNKLFIKRPDLRNILFWSAVVFPYITFKTESPEWHPWQVIDLSDLNARPLSSLIERVLDKAREYASGKTGHFWLRNNKGEPSPKQASEIEHELRPEFEFFESPRSRSRRVSDELKTYTEEQFIALDAMVTNPRVSFIGPAGTGKTLLAIESARRAASYGSKVLMLCFNRFLGVWLAEQVASIQNVLCDTIHNRMVQVAGVETDKESLDSDFWHRLLPDRAINTLLENSSTSHQFDELILDEAQDILVNQSYLDFLDLSLNGGLASGKWRFFGDFERQAIYKQSDQFYLPNSEKIGPVATYSLTVNCRNTPRIASMASSLGALNPDYTKVLRPDNGVDPEWLYYNETEDQKPLLIETLEKLLQRGYRADEIAVLSTHSDSGCIAATIDKKPWADRLRPLRAFETGSIGFSSIHAFKGMEKPAVIVTDVDKIRDGRDQVLLYVGASRAVDSLHIMVNHHVRKRIQETLLLKKPPAPFKMISK